MSKALDDIAVERQRQIEVEGWTPEHDDKHHKGEMARAASCYSWGATLHEGMREIFGTGEPPPTWPDSWGRVWWKPTTRRRDLVKAGALIIAEIERLDRMAERESQP